MNQPPRASTGGRAPVRMMLDPTITSRASFHDPSVPLVSIHTRQLMDTYGIRPRPSLQVYYTAQDAAEPAALETAARTLETTVLGPEVRLENSDFRDRLDVYGLPLAASSAQELARACIEHQQAEIAARNTGGDKDWYIQRWDLGGGSPQYARLLLVISRPVAEWAGGGGDPRGIVVAFDRTAEGEAGGAREAWIRESEDLQDFRWMVKDERRGLGWDACQSQFDD
ncbi:hypothetical protein GQ53DRAFT_31287 [Thozetella sp. PMI_491]|nr:hypothetical protein GQ53DRAFT_31287 [Thozetella sp. PMI_491]